MSKKRTIDIGKKVRYDRIVNPAAGKTVMIPLDHGVILGPIAGIEDPRETVRRVVAGGADAVIFNAGVALGRNVWQSSDPARTTRALADIIHRGKKPGELEGALE